MWRSQTLGIECQRRPDLLRPLLNLVTQGQLSRRETHLLWKVAKEPEFLRVYDSPLIGSQNKSVVVRLMAGDALGFVCARTSPYIIHPFAHNLVTRQYMY